MKIRRARWMAVVFLLSSLPGWAEFIGGATSLNGCGGWASNGLFSSLMSVGQAGPIGDSAGIDFLGHSGFLETYITRPFLDTDGDGIPNENDPDNDADGLSDDQELAGIAFSPGTPSDPNKKDSDNDGASDQAEAMAGTNPTDPNSLLELCLVRCNGPQLTLRWKSRMGLHYDIVTADTVSRLSNGRALARVTGAAGSAPWFESETGFTNPIALNNAFFTIQLAP